MRQGETYADLTLLLKVEKISLTTRGWRVIRNISNCTEDKYLNEVLCQYITMKKKMLKLKIILHEEYLSVMKTLYSYEDSL